MFHWLTGNPFETAVLPIGDWVAKFVSWLVANYRFIFQNIKQPIDVLLSGIETNLRSCPPLVFIGIMFLLAWQAAQLRVAIFVAAALTVVGLIGAWLPAMTTLAIVLTSVLFCCVVGIPLGIFAAHSDRFDKAIRPVLDFLQTVPSFVYLVPIVMLFGIGNVAGVFVTIIYALSPIIRLTALGIRQVRADLVERLRRLALRPSRHC
jgi:glycine betaine/proline transport system permease protein